MEWKCTIQSSTDPYDHIKVGGEWGAFVRSMSYGGGDSFDVWITQAWE
jgi:hypothetical protein